MTTTDTDALTERLRDRLIETFAQQDPRPEFATVEAVKIAHLVLPAVAEEVRKAKAEALREAVEECAITILDGLGYKVHAVIVEDLLEAAAEYETGDSDEHR